MESVCDLLTKLCRGLPLDHLPPCPPLTRDPSVPHAPVQQNPLSPAEAQRAVVNALRYFPSRFHEILAPEFALELRTYGHIYMYRFKPTMAIKAYPITAYPAKCMEAAAIMVMIMNNLDPDVAQFPHELVTYGGNGQVFSNWAQFLLVMEALSRMCRKQTLVMYSGHPLGLFPSSPSAPRMVITNGMVIPNYSSRREYDRMFALGVSMYGQMTAGSYCYIGPQGIVHGTTLTIMNAGRNHLKTGDLSGKVFVSSGLGGMSGAQAKAAVICGCIGVIAEVSTEAIQKRYNQGWVKEIINNIDDLIKRIREAREKQEVTSIAYHGNVVDVWERLADVADSTGELLVELGSDQTSCHNPYGGGYFPVQLSMEVSLEMIKKDPSGFKEHVQESLRRQSEAIGRLHKRGLYFWDYGNAFLLEAQRSGADVTSCGDCMGTRFKYPSYVQDIMGDIFSLGFGPVRWVCLSGDPEDLEATDSIALQTLHDLMNSESLPPNVVQQYEDNIRWIAGAAENKLVVGSQARILYSDLKGRVELALAFNRAVTNCTLKGPVVLSRDHHDVSGTDSPFRETSNIYDGSAFTADMAVQNCIGDSFRGATWVALHNGGGVGWGEVINGGFGLLLDGSEESEQRARSMLSWDVSNGVARRCWSGNTNAYDTIQRAMEDNELLRVTLPNAVVDQSIVQGALLPSDVS